MTAEEFVRAVRKVVLEAAVESTLGGIDNPPGRRPRRDLLEAHLWYSKLDEASRGQVRRVATMVAEQAVFGLLAVLDGDRVVESSREKGEFRLVFAKGEKQWELTRGDVPLHDLLSEPDDPSRVQ